MFLITWDSSDVKIMESLPTKYGLVFSIIEKLENGYEVAYISAEDAISICRYKLLGEYHCILVKKMEESLDDAELYLVTYDCEASDGGVIHKLDYLTMEKIAKGVLFKKNC